MRFARHHPQANRSGSQPRVADGSCHSLSAGDVSPGHSPVKPFRSVSSAGNSVAPLAHCEFPEIQRALTERLFRNAGGPCSEDVKEVVPLSLDVGAEVSPDASCFISTGAELADGNGEAGTVRSSNLSTVSTWRNAGASGSRRYLGIVFAVSAYSPRVASPTAVIAVTATAMMKPPMTAYSTDVGPSSLTRNR